MYIHVFIKMDVVTSKNAGEMLIRVNPVVYCFSRNGRTPFDLYQLTNDVRIRR